MKKYTFLIGYINKNGKFAMERRDTKAKNSEEAWKIECKVASCLYGEKLDRVVLMSVEDLDEHEEAVSEQNEFYMNRFKQVK